MGDQSEAMPPRPRHRQSRWMSIACGAEEWSPANPSVRFIRSDLMRKLLALAMVAIATYLAGCSPLSSLPKAEPYQSRLDPLALQQMQTQDFETTKRVLFAATVSVFQDTGYTIETGDLETGLVTAKSPTTVAAAGQFGFVRTSTGETVELRATAFVEDFRLGYSRVRLNFIERRTNLLDRETGGVAHDIPNEDPAYYEMVFNKIREAVFLRDALQPKSPTK